MHVCTYLVVFTFLHPGRCTYVYMLRARLYYDTCAPLLRHVRASTSTSIYVHVRDQNDNATYASTRWVPTVRHFLVCEDVVGGFQQLGGESFLLPVIWMHFLACEDVAGRSQQSGGMFFHEIRWPIRWVPTIRWRNNYFARNKEALAAAVDPTVSLSTYITLLMEVNR